MAVLLETEEVIGAPWRVASASAAVTRKVLPGQHGSCRAALQACNDLVCCQAPACRCRLSSKRLLARHCSRPGPEPLCTVQVYDEHSELTGDLLLTHFILSIPAEAWASFATPLVSLRWLLHFELVSHVPQGPRGWLGGAAQPDWLSWTLPLLVVAPDS